MQEGLSALVTIYKRELLGYFRRPIAYVFIAAFNLAAMISTFLINSWLDSDQADLMPFFSWLPWLLLVLVPGIGVRSWAEEKSSGTLELTLTLPFDSHIIVLGKFLAGWTILGLALGLSFPLGLTAAYLGAPDSGAMASGYLGGFLMAGSLLAVSTLCSLLSRLQVVSFVLSVLSCLVLLLCGWGVFSDFLLTVLPLSVVEQIAYLGVITHYDALSRGVVPLQDLIYFILLSSTALCLSYFLLISRRGGEFKWSQILSLSPRRLLVLAGLGVAMTLNAFLTYRIDLSENQAYSISEKSLAIAASIDKPITANLFFSRSLPEATPFMKQYSQRVKAVLEEYALHTQGRLKVRVVDPKPDTPEEDEAIRLGLAAQTGPNGALYFGVAFLSETKESSIPWLNPQQEDLLEYEIAKALIALKTQQKPRLGLMSSLDLQKGLSNSSGQSRPWALLDELGKSFAVEEFKVLTEPLPADLGVLFIIHPKDFDKTTWKMIDAFIQRGGRVLLAVDPFSRVELIQKHGKAQLTAGADMPNFNSQAAPILAAWGIAFDPTQVVGDPNRATMINIFGQSVPYPLFVKSTRGDLGTAPYMQNLKEILIAEGGSLSLLPGSALKMEPLLQTTADAGMMGTFPLAFQDARQTSALFSSSGGKRILAASFSGIFPSAFAATAPAQASEMIVFADVDLLEDRHAIKLANAGQQSVKVPRNDNLNFALNSLEYLAGSASLMGIRNAGVIARPFETVRELQKQAEARWREEEKVIQEKIKNSQRQLSSYYAKDAAANRLQLRPEDLKVIKHLRHEGQLLEQRFRRIRLNLREDSQRIARLLIAGNLLAAPLMVACMALGFSWYRFRSLRWRYTLHGLYALIPSLAGAFLLAWVFYAKSSVQLHAAPFFEHLFDMEALAGVQKLTITENGGVATLLKDPDGTWRMAEASGQVVNADRLSRLLYDLSDAKIVRKLTAAQSQTDAYGFDKGRSLTLSGQFQMKILIGKQQASGAYLVQVEGKDHPYLIDDILHTYVSPEFWLASPQ